MFSCRCFLPSGSFRMAAERNQSRDTLGEVTQGKLSLQKVNRKGERAGNASEQALDSPLTTVSTVCGRSREMARPRALRYLFSWSRLESSCSLKNKLG